MEFIFKGGKPPGSYAENNNRDYEAQLYYKLENGTINDYDINYILEYGDRGLREALERKHNQMYQEKKHIDRIYGEGIFDGRDRSGNFYKDLTNGIDENTFIS